MAEKTSIGFWVLEKAVMTIFFIYCLITEPDETIKYLRKPHREKNIPHHA